MIDETTRSYVRSIIENTPERTGDIDSVLVRGRRRRRAARIGTVASVVTLVLLTVGSVLWLRPTNRPFTSKAQPADLTVVVNPPDQEPGAQVLAMLAGPGITEGNLDFMGWVKTDGNRFDIVAYNVVGGAPAGSADVSTCLAVVSVEANYSAGACQPGSELPPAPGSLGNGQVINDLFYYIVEIGPAGIDRAVVTTTQGQTIEIQTAKIVFATWPISWGPPQSLTYVDGTGTTLDTINY